MHLHSIFISPGHNYYGHHGLRPDEHQMLALPSVKCVAGSGLAGDRFFDYEPDYKGQVTFFSLEVHERLQVEYDREYSPSLYRRNLIVSGADLNELIGQEFAPQILVVRTQGLNIGTVSCFGVQIVWIELLHVL